MKHFIFTLLAFLAIAAGVSAQQESYRLDQYVNPDYKRKQLDFTLQSEGAISSMKSFSEDYDRQRISGNTSLGYAQVANSAKVQSQLDAGVSLSGMYTNTDQALATMNGDYKLGLTFNNQAYYYVADRRFVEFSPTAKFNFVRSKSKEDHESSGATSQYTEERKNKDLSFSASFNLGYGIGRIEQVGDARQAMYILSDLQRYGLLKRQLNDEEVNALAAQMTTVKNKRQFDSRIKLIEEITAVDSFMVANGYVDAQHTAPYFTSLYDNWQYAGLIERKSGSRLSAGVTPSYFYTKDEWDYTYTPSVYPNQSNTVSSDVKSAAVYVDWQYEKPVNLYWQHSAGVNVSETWQKVELKESDLSNESWNSSLNGFFALGYYPSSRTYMTGTARQRLGYANRGKTVSTYTSARFNMYYYLSPQLRLTANAGLTYSYVSSDFGDGRVSSKYKYPNFDFSFGLTYSIF